MFVSNGSYYITIIYTVHPVSIHSPSLFPHFFNVTALLQNGLNSLFSSKFYKQYPIMTTGKMFFIKMY